MNYEIINIFYNGTGAAITIQHLAHTVPDIQKKPYFCCWYNSTVIPICAKMGKLAHLDATSRVVVLETTVLEQMNNKFRNIVCTMHMASWPFSLNCKPMYIVEARETMPRLYALLLYVVQKINQCTFSNLLL